MAVLLIAEHNNKELRPFTLNAATAASQIDSDVHAVIIGQNSADAAKQLSELPVVKKVLSVEGAHYENFTAENFAPVIVKLAENYSHIVCSANTFGKNLMPRIAAHLDTSQVSDIIKVISPDTFLRPIYAGNAFATIKSNDAKKCVTSDPLLSIHVRAQVDQPQLKKWMLVKSFQIQNLSKEKKLNLIDLNLEQQELLYQVAGNAKWG